MHASNTSRHSVTDRSHGCSGAVEYLPILHVNLKGVVSINLVPLVAFKEIVLMDFVFSADYPLTANMSLKRFVLIDFAFSRSLKRIVLTELAFWAGPNGFS